ncbi:MAG TPA: chorismate-binding protein, partial [Candidatus Dormibacteraeota bacterium]|nr:chorismate-binding protein [Candidatus Dormibacteraeota bacterium]
MLLNRRELPSTTDLISAAGTARDNGHEVALIERPLPEAVSVAALGKAFELVATEGGASLEDADGQVIDTEPGDNRIAAAARLWNRFANGRAAGGADQSPSDLIAVGGWAFDPDADPQGPWLGFPSLLLRVPALALVRKRGRVFATATSAQAWDLLKPGATSFQAPGASRIKVDLAQSAAKWLNIVEQVRHRIRADEASKVVLAREVLADGDGVIAAAEVGRALRASFPGCYTYVIGGSDGSALVGASPELLIRRRGSLALSEPMAGSIRRGRDEDEDDRLAQELL